MATDFEPVVQIDPQTGEPIDLSDSKISYGEEIVSVLVTVAPWEEKDAYTEEVDDEN